MIVGSSLKLWVNVYETHYPLRVIHYFLRGFSETTKISGDVLLPFVFGCSRGSSTDARFRRQKQSGVGGRTERPDRRSSGAGRGDIVKRAPVSRGVNDSGRAGAIRFERRAGGNLRIARDKRPRVRNRRQGRAHPIPA